MIKTLGMLKRKKDLTREQFLEHWEKVHAPLFLSKKMPPGLRKYIQNHPAKGASPEFDTSIDGIAELWFDNVASAEAFYEWLRSSEEAKECREDSPLYVDVEERLLFLAEEHVLKE
jgi:uncharacterized protein (TIGR02118 family)